MSTNGTPGNLQPAWRPGQSGNPNGRPKGQTVTTLLRRALTARRLCGVPTLGNRDVADCLAEAIILHAIKGNIGYLKAILDRTEGPVSSAVPESGGPVVCYIERAHNPPRPAS
ncbi:MAG: DUF5681 domain-containing protein [Isosphaeraceae bacterium]